MTAFGSFLLFMLIIAAIALLDLIANAIIERAVGAWLSLVLAAPIGGGRYD